MSDVRRARADRDVTRGRGIGAFDRCPRGSQSIDTISRELRRNREPGERYLASSAHAMAYHHASRPKAAKLATNMVLRAKVEQDLEKKYSPEQITGRLRLQYPEDPEMRVSPETIYQSLYVQSRGAPHRVVNQTNVRDTPS